MQTDKQFSANRMALACIVAVSLAGANLAFGKTLTGNVSQSARIGQRWGNQPLNFEENRGQTSPEFQFVARAHGFQLATKPTGALLYIKSSTVGLNLIGANRTAAVQGLAKLAGTVNYLFGDQPDRFVKDVPTFARVLYRDVYQGVDLAYYGNQRSLEYDFIVAPFADPGKIRIQLVGINGLEIYANGDLVMHTPSGKLRQHRPVAYQERNGGRDQIDAHYRTIGTSEVEFDIGPYDSSRPLVIDPVIAYSTYLGGAGEERGNGVAVDGQGNAYVVGETNLGGSTKYAFVRKFNAAGAVVYTSFVGNGQCNSKGNGIAVDTAGNAVLTGLYGFFDQWGYCNMGGVLVSKLNTAGNGFVYNKYFGGSGELEAGNAVALDAQGNAYVTGRIFGTLPATTGAYQFEGQGWDDAFVLKLNTGGAIVYATYLGGGWMDEGASIAVDSTGKVTVAGSTSSTDFPVSTSGYRRTRPNTSVTGFVSQLNASGTQLLYSTYFGGSRAESIGGVAIDSSGKIYITGTTSSNDFPTTANAFDRVCGSDGYCNPHYVDYSMHYAEDAFIAKIDPAASGAASLIYSSFFGGMNRELARAIWVDSAGQVYVAGRTQSLADFPLVTPIQSDLAGGDDGFVAQFDVTRAGASSLLFSTFLGGVDYDEIQGLALDSARNIFLTGYTGSTDFPTRNADQPVTGGGYDAFVTKIGVSPLGVNTVTLNPVSVNGGQSATGTVTLTGPAPANGLVIAISSGNPMATVPTTVAVPAGANSTSFNVTTTPVSTTVIATISASVNGVAKTVSLTVKAPAVTGVSLNPTSVTGGASSTGTVSLSSAAPAAGLIIALATNNAAATVPSIVEVPAGAKTAIFAVATKAVTFGTPILVSALFGTVTKSATLTVNAAAALTSIAITPATVTGGTAVSGKVTLSAAASAEGAVVTLKSSNSGVAAVPASVTVAAGATSANFNITTKAVTTAASVTISGTHSGLTKTSTLAVNPASAALKSLAFAPASVVAGISSVGTIILSAPAPVGGAIVKLSSKNIAATVPASVTVTAGTTTKTFAVSTRGVVTTTTVSIAAAYSGITRTASLNVKPATISTLAVVPGSLEGGAKAIGTVTLSGLAPVPGAAISMASGNPAIVVPTTVTIASGAKTVTFALNTRAVSVTTPVTISATYAASTKTAVVTVKPIALASLTVPAAVKGSLTPNDSVLLTAGLRQGE